MPRGFHPDLVNGALIGALVTRTITPAVGDPTIVTEGVNENNEPILLETPNPDYVPARDITLETIRTAATNANIDVSDVFFSGDAPEGQARVACQIYVAPHDASQIEQDAVQATRAALNEVFAQFA